MIVMLLMRVTTTGSQANNYEFNDSVLT